MKRIVFAVAAGLMLAACGGAPEGKFTKNCQTSMEAEGASANEDTAMCKCAYAKLDVELSDSQLKLAAELIGVSDPEELAKAAQDPDKVFVLERAQGAVKSCAL